MRTVDEVKATIEKLPRREQRILAAWLNALLLVKTPLRRPRTLLPEFRALMQRPPAGNPSEALNATRANR